MTRKSLTTCSGSLVSALLAAAFLIIKSHRLWSISPVAAGGLNPRFSLLTSPGRQVLTACYVTGDEQNKES